MTPGTTYSFKVAARNTFGYSEESDPVSILAAQEPFQPGPPTTTLSGDQVIITWNEPSTGGSPITSYSIEIYESDGITHTPDLNICDGLDLDIVASRQCVVPVITLISEPYSLTWADSVYVTITASNLYGTSVYSLPGNGAILYTVPDAPSDLTEDLSLRSNSVLAFSWSTTFVGGTPIIDYTVTYDNGLDTYTVLESGVTSKYYIATGLTYGVTYKFKVSARNAFGESELSEEFSLLCATKPLQPAAPTTARVNENLVVQWTEPNTQGTPIIGYKVYIRAADQTYIHESANCLGYLEVVISTQQCSIPLDVIHSAPYSLILGNSIYAQVIAENFYGFSPMSAEGNGALMTLVPDAPIDLVENVFVTTRTHTEFSWTDGASDGGSPVLDYRVWYDQGVGEWVVLESGILDPYTTTVELHPGRTYTFKVEARNTVGYSEFSETISILFAQLPGTPQAPITTLVGEEIRIDWTAPDDGGAEITAYTVEIRHSDGVTFSE